MVFLNEANEVVFLGPAAFGGPALAPLAGLLGPAALSALWSAACGGTATGQ